MVPKAFVAKSISSIFRAGDDDIYGGGQYIILVEELDLLVVVTASENDNSTLQIVAERILPAFLPD